MRVAVKDRHTNDSRFRCPTRHLSVTLAAAGLQICNNVFVVDRARVSPNTGNVAFPKVSQARSDCPGDTVKVAFNSLSEQLMRWPHCTRVKVLIRNSSTLMPRSGMVCAAVTSSLKF